MNMQVEGFFCEMCKKWADRCHVTSAPHLKRKKWFDGMAYDQQLLWLDNFRQSADEYWQARKQTESIGRGEGKSQTDMEKSQMDGRDQPLTGSRGLEATSSVAPAPNSLGQTNKDARTSDSTGSGHVQGGCASAAAFACDGGRSDASCDQPSSRDLQGPLVPEEVKDESQEGGEEQAGLSSEDSDSDSVTLRNRLSDTLGGPWTVWVRGPCAWLPLVGSCKTPMLEVYTTVAVAFVCSTVWNLCSGRQYCDTHGGRSWLVA